MMLEGPIRLVLRYSPPEGSTNGPGQFTFRDFRQTATDEQLFNLAHRLNSFQEDEVDRIFRVHTFTF